MIPQNYSFNKSLRLKSKQKFLVSQKTRPAKFTGAVKQSTKLISKETYTSLLREKLKLINAEFLQDLDKEELIESILKQRFPDEE